MGRVIIVEDWVGCIITCSRAERFELRVGGCG